MTKNKLLVTLAVLQITISKIENYFLSEILNTKLG